jgi:hypothetical protein
MIQSQSTSQPTLFLLLGIEFLLMILVRESLHHGLVSPGLSLLYIGLGDDLNYVLIIQIMIHATTLR